MQLSKCPCNFAQATLPIILLLCSFIIQLCLVTMQPLQCNSTCNFGNTSLPLHLYCNNWNLKKLSSFLTAEFFFVSASVVHYGINLNDLVRYGFIWPCMSLYGLVWHYLAFYGFIYRVLHIFWPAKKGYFSQMCCWYRQNNSS